MNDIAPEESGTTSASVAYVVQSDVLCVNLDGTLLKTVTLWECLLKALKIRPSIIFLIPIWMMRGRHLFKQCVTKVTGCELDWSYLPRHLAVERLMVEARAAGKRVEIVSSDHRFIAGQFAEIAAEIIGSSDDVNLSGKAKADFLRKRYPGGFAYVGNSAADLPVWYAATERYGIDLTRSVRRRAAREGLGLIELPRANSRMTALLLSLRLHQWLKNLLIFVPLGLMVSHAGLIDLIKVSVGFLLLGLLASATYLFNDIMDVESDRQHPGKRKRPIAKGDLPLPLAFPVSLGLGCVALIGSFWLDLAFGVTVASYLVVTVAYSLYLKRLPLIDVLVIAGLFTLRIVSGMTLVPGVISEWLLAFSMFFFFSLALMKREIELRLVAEGHGKGLHGRGYAVEDSGVVLTLGISTGVAALIIFALLVSVASESPEARYSRPELLWGTLLALSYWLMRMWLLANRGVLHDDPIFHAVRERASLILGIAASLFALGAQLL